MLRRFTRIVSGMVVYPERMRENLERSRGVVFSGTVLLELARHDVSREQAYEWVQRNAMRSFAEGLDFSDNGQALDAILTNEPGTHYLGSAHTLANFESAFYRSEIADNNSYEQWEAEGAKDANQRATEAAQRLLAQYEPPPLDPAIDEALLDFMARRKAELPNAVT